MGKDSFSLASLDSSLKEGAKGKRQIPCSPSKREPRGNGKLKQGRNGLMPYLAEMQDRK